MIFNQNLNFGDINDSQLAYHKVKQEYQRALQ